MIRSNIKKNLIILLIASLAVVLGVFAFLIPTHGAKAEGNNAGSSVITDFILIELDVNGRAPSNSERDNASTDIDANNKKRFSSRVIHANAITGKDDATYILRSTSVVNGSGEFSVKVGEDTTSLEITALKQTRRDANAGFFSVDVQRGTGSSAPVTKYYFKVIVGETFVQHTSLGAGEDSEIYVGNKLNAASTGEVSPSYEGGNHLPIFDLNNYSSSTVDLGELLKGRALYNGSEPIKTSDDKYWAINSVSNFAITDVRLDDLTSAIPKESKIYSNSTPALSSDAGVIIDPTATFDIKVSSDAVKRYNDLNPGKDFWANTHMLAVDLREVKDETKGKYTIYIPINIVPSNPQAVDISSDLVRLNVTSEYGYNLSTGQYLNADGTVYDGTDVYDFGYILVRPTDLLEYAYPSTFNRDMLFDHAETLLNNSNALTTQQGCRIDRVGDELDNQSTVPSVYKISGLRSNLANTSFNISFTIIYPVAASGAETTKTKEVKLSVSTYGGYTVKFSPINGKKAVSYNVLNAGVFADMRERGYQLTGAVSNNPNQLGVTLSNNVLTLTPKVDNINGQTTADVELTFTNNSKQTITFTSEIIDINVNAGSLFARFDDWQAWLIIAACILGGILIILLVVWLFIRSISKRKQDELATQAPVSSYIVKLNSTIAATQAQQRMAQNQALSQASAQMLLGAGPTGAAATPPDTLALASGVQSMPGGTPSMPSAPAMSEPQAMIPPDPNENLEELIAKYITDEELLERIFTEKYEPKGMVRRTFFKSKDLQARELEKEKRRIIERYKSPMPMDEAIMSESEIQKAEATSSPAAVSSPAETEQQTEMFVLDFDPDSPLYVEPAKTQDEFSEEKIDLDSSPEEQKLKDTEHRYDIILKELEELKSRLDKVQSELDKAKSLEDELREKIAKAEADDEQYGKDIEDLEFKLASAKSKDKEKITRDIGIKEEKKQRNLDDLERLRAELSTLLGNSDNLNAVYVKLDGLNTQKTEEKQNIEQELEKARADFAAYQDRLAKVKARQELEVKITGLSPLLVDVNNSDYELRRLQTEIDKQDKERDALKSAVATAKSQILGATDFGIINDLNTQISDSNTMLSDLEKESTKTNKRKTELQIEFNAQRRKANEFVEKNEIPLEEVILAEDNVIGNIELELLKTAREKDKEEAEKAVAEAQAVYDDLAVSSTDVTMIAMEVAANVKDIEDEIEATQAELDQVNAQMEAASDDERLMLIVEQGDKTDKLEELKAKLDQANVEGTKRKMEAQGEYDAKLEEARAALERANNDYSTACTAYDDLINNTNPIDLIVSGSGVISQDQKKIEAENFKKQLERSKNEIEQARLAAQQAQEQAEQARLDAERASEEARLEAERTAQEAIERAEQARLEAEERARAEVEAAERARVEAEEALAAEAEEAKRKAQEESEEAARKAQEDAEEAARKAQEEVDEAVRKAQEETEEAKRKAQEEIEEMRRKAEEDAEAKRLEEENKRKEEEERQKAESERSEVIAKKVAMRKEQIVAIRNEMKELKGDEDAKNLRERLYNIQLTYDEDERGVSELMDFYSKTMDDIQNAGEIARLKAENAKKPQRVVRKVTERVNRIPKRKARPGARPASSRNGTRRPASRATGARSASSRAGARPASRPGARPAARPGARPTRQTTRPGGSGTRPTRPK